MNWKEVRISLNLEAVEAAINILQEYGTRGVITKNIEDNKEKSRQLVTAYFPDNDKFDKLLAEIKTKINNLSTYNLDASNVYYQINLCKDRNWNKSWHKFFKPQPVGKFIICPSWEDCSDENRIVINLDPGQAFGTGCHITTRLALSLIESCVAINNIDNMLDIGTGTAVLSIAAARLGVKNIMGIDIDRAAVRAAQKNIEINNVSEYITIKQSNLFSAVTDKYSLVVANLLPNIILRLLPELPLYVKKKGFIILSGINDNYEKDILDQLNRLQLELVDKISKEDWTALVAQKG